MLTARITRVTVDEIIAHLYGLPAAEFTRKRDEAARELRREGRRVEAERVKELRKPTAAAAAVNRLVRGHRREVEQFLSAATTLRDAQFAGKGDLAAAIKREREALERLIRAGGEPVRQTLLAAAVDEDAARELLEARLERELESRGFGSLLADAPPPRTAKPKPARPAERKPDDRAARTQLQEAKRRLSAAVADEREARRHWEQSRKRLEEAQAAVELARRKLDRLRGV
jgi:hypothetical protein